MLMSSRLLAPKSIVMRLTPARSTPARSISSTRPTPFESRPCGVTGSVSHTWSGRSDGASFWRARIAMARRMFAAASSSAAPSMSRSIVLASYRSTTERYASVREAWFLHTTASSELADTAERDDGVAAALPDPRDAPVEVEFAGGPVQVVLRAPRRRARPAAVGDHEAEHRYRRRARVGVLEGVRRLEGHVRVGREPGAGRSGGDALDGAVRPLPPHVAEHDQTDDDHEDDQDAERREPAGRRGGHERTTESELGWISIR